MRVLIACEFSGVERRAFRRRGHDAWSCDLLPAEDGARFHFTGDVLGVLDQGWDLMIGHPPCTRLCVSGNRWRAGKEAETEAAAAFFMALVEAPIPRIAIENPVGIMSTRYRRPDQIVHPHQFGHPETKATCLWLKGLPLLKPTDLVMPLEHRVHRAAPGPNRWKERSRTLEGFARAVAEQWGTLTVERAA